MALKAQFNLGRECYDAIMTIFGRFLPKGHVLPANLYQSDKILRALKMPYEKIHACEKGCALFRLQYADLNYCPICKSSRYVVVDNSMGEKTQTKIPLNVLRVYANRTKTSTSFHGRRDGKTDDMAQNRQKNPTRCRWEADDGAHIGR